MKRIPLLLLLVAIPFAGEVLISIFDRSAAAQPSFSTLELSPGIFTNLSRIWAPYVPNLNHTNGSFIGATSQGMTNTSREVETTSGVYRVDYRFNAGFWSTPLTLPPGDPHHDATINVIKDGVWIGKPIKGTYVNGSCKMCDDPPAYVQRAVASEFRVMPTNGYPIWSSPVVTLTNFNVHPVVTFPLLPNLIIQPAVTNDFSVSVTNSHWIRLNLEIQFRPDGTVGWRAIK